MGSKTYEGVRFSVYPNDHLPPHVHGSLDGVVVVMDLLGDGAVRVSARRKAILPVGARQNVIAKIRRIAAENAYELEALWENTHGAR
jgi:hypothetical protein